VRASLVVFCVLAAASVAAAASSGASETNVRGTFVRSTETTKCYQGEPCDPPPQAAFLLFTRNGYSTRVRLGANGTFAVRLAAGLYRVSILPSRGSTVSPAAIRVPLTGVIHPRFVQRTQATG
jgi:hypothetical protein